MPDDKPVFSFSKDPMVNAVYLGIKDDIRFLLENGRLRGALVLTLSGIDAMAFLSLPSGRDDVKKVDFIAWADRYMKVVINKDVTGQEIYAARCAALHCYATESALCRKGVCRQIIWMSEAIPDVIFQPNVHPSIVILAIPSLVESFLTGIDNFLVDLHANPQTSKLADQRLKKIMMQFPGPAAKQSE